MSGGGHHTARRAPDDVGRHGPAALGPDEGRLLDRMSEYLADALVALDWLIDNRQVEPCGAIAGHCEASENVRISTMNEPHSIDELLARARATLDRVSPECLADEQAQGAVVVDIRPVEQRLRDGALPGAIVIDRNVLEWRLDPSCEHRIDQATGYDLRIVIVCNEGYSSSLAAATLQELGLRRATDLIGGYQAWLAAAE